MKEQALPGKDHSAARVAVVTIAGLLLLVTAAVLSVCKGAVEIPVSTVLQVFGQFDETNQHHLIIMDLRLPRLLASLMVGAALAVAGAVMQGVTRNPLADSGLMGLSAGSGLALAICFAFFQNIPYIGILLCSFAGAAFGSLLVYGTASAKKGGATPMRLVLAGAAVSAMLSAFSQGIALHFKVAQNIMFWTSGGVAGTNWEQLKVLAPVLGAALLAAVALSKRVSLLNLGDEVSAGLGLNIGMSRLLCNAVVLVLAGASVAVVGVVSFVGLMIPHLTRFLVGSDYQKIIPVSAIYGAVLMVLSDLVARTISPPFEVPIGAVIALLGVPFFLYIARKQRRAA